MLGGPGDPPPGAILSPDRRYWWNGHEWALVPGGTTTPSLAPHPGFWARHKLHVAEKHYAEQLKEWETHVEGLNEYLQLIDNFTGVPQADGVFLKAGEMVFGTIGGTALVETRVSGGHWVSGSQGFSVPVGSIGGRSIRYRVGRSRGHFVQGEPTPTAIDRGSTIITSGRVIFAGGSQTRECSYSKLVGYRHDASEVTLSVSNRQKPTTIHYGQGLESWFVERFELALAHFRGTVPDLRHSLTALLEEAEQHKPVPPSGPAPAGSA
jgi:hypothetical protein